jgi:signal transduction histidine kinase
MRIDGAARETAYAGRIERRNARIVDLYRKLRDVRSDLEMKNRALSDAMENIRRMETFKDAFLSSISHEMRTPLTIIRSYVDLLLHYPPESRERETEFLEVIDAETTKLTMHINKILDLTEIRANEVQLELSVNVVADLARAAIREIDTLYGEKRPRIECTIPEQVPNVIADRDRTIQILVDLLDNALKFSADGGAITLAAQESPGDRTGPFVTIWVADRGIGIGAEQQSKIFEQFSQITEAARGKPRGIGLGLPICKAYVERMGGKMWLESEPGHGSTFYVSLPGTRDRAGDS